MTEIRNMLPVLAWSSCYHELPHLLVPSPTLSSAYFSKKSWIIVLLEITLGT